MAKVNIRLRELGRLVRTLSPRLRSWRSAARSWRSSRRPPRRRRPPPGPVRSCRCRWTQAVAMALEANLGLKAERLNLDVAVAVHRDREGRRSCRSASGDLAQLPPSPCRRISTHGHAAVIVERSISAAAVRSVQQLPWYGGQLLPDVERPTASTRTARRLPFQSLSRIDAARRLHAAAAARLQDGYTARRRRDGGTAARDHRHPAPAAGRRHRHQCAARLSRPGRRDRRATRSRSRTWRFANSRWSRRARASRSAQSPQIDVIQAEAVVASNREQVIVAQAGIDRRRQPARDHSRSQPPRLLAGPLRSRPTRSRRCRARSTWTARSRTRSPTVSIWPSSGASSRSRISTCS